MMGHIKTPTEEKDDLKKDMLRRKAQLYQVGYTVSRVLISKRVSVL